MSPQEQGKALLALGPAAVLMKGGHADGAVCHDYLITSNTIAIFEAPRIATDNTHGTGCSLSSAIAAGLAKSLPLDAAVGAAHRWLHGAIKAADDLDIGQGHGPVHHFTKSGDSRWQNRKSRSLVAALPGFVSLLNWLNAAWRFGCLTAMAVRQNIAAHGGLAGCWRHFVRARQLKSLWYGLVRRLRIGGSGIMLMSNGTAHWC